MFCYLTFEIFDSQTCICISFAYQPAAWWGCGCELSLWSWCV